MFLSCSPEIGDLKLDPRRDLPVGCLGETDSAWLGDALEPRRDVDAVAHEVAVALLDDIADMDADPELNAPVHRNIGVAHRDGCSHFDGAAHGADDAAELDERAVAGELYGAALMGQAIDGSIRSPRKARRRERVRTSSVPVSRL